jgi:uncharacterized protein
MNTMKSPFNILSIDGGGIRGIYAAHILNRMDQEYNIDWKTKFHLFAGTSTGSIIAAGLASGININDIVNFYKNYTADVFSKRLLCRKGFFASRYKNSALKYYLKKVFGDITLGDVNVPLIIPATDIGNGCVYVFKSNYDKLFVRDKLILVRDAILASCSAPTYFDPIKVNNYYLADGGLWGNCPSLIGIVDAKHRLNQKLDDIKVLSLGTGISNKYYSQKSSFIQNILGWGIALKWGNSKFIEMIFNLQSETATNLVGLLLKKEQILRLNFKSDRQLTLDNPREVEDLLSCADRDFTYKSKNIATFLNISL